ncbi:Putative RxLR effector [Phytophthora palmivora]|uniref:RxLR effector protein n=1 Tax=Phytophthora palmivora TaxID=4796 RepID=A0A2P4XQ94_9STRA|nr:Putative RxLR effector [Phytophthora palmivora]
MRVLLVVMISMFATSTVASVPIRTKVSIVGGIQSNGVANNQHQRFLRSQAGNENNKGEERRLQSNIPLTFVKDLLAKDSLRGSTFQGRFC